MQKLVVSTGTNQNAKVSVECKKLNLDVKSLFLMQKLTLYHFLLAIERGSLCGGWCRGCGSGFRAMGRGSNPADVTYYNASELSKTQ